MDRKVVALLAVGVGCLLRASDVVGIVSAFGQVGSTLEFKRACLERIDRKADRWHRQDYANALIGFEGMSADAFSNAAWSATSTGDKAAMLIMAPEAMIAEKVGAAKLQQMTSLQSILIKYCSDLPKP